MVIDYSCKTIFGMSAFAHGYHFISYAGHVFYVCNINIHHSEGDIELNRNKCSEVAFT